MKELIERLEKATEPDRETDHRIGCAIAGVEFVSLDLSGAGESLRWRGPKNAKVYAPAYTASIDAALTLVPGGPRDAWWSVEVARSPDSPLRSFGGRPEVYMAKVARWSESGKEHCGHSDTPAIALCIAALKARADTAASVAHR